MSRVIHFEIQAADPERAAKFYQATFHWKFAKLAESQAYWIITTGEDDKPGINGGMLIRNGQPPIDGQSVNAYVCTIEVTHLEESLKAVEHHGGTVAVPKMEIPNIGWLAYCKDTEGNIFGIMEPLNNSAL